MAQIREVFRFPNPHQFANVSPGETKTVFTLQVPINHVGFIESIGNQIGDVNEDNEEIDVGYDQAQAKWMIDGIVWENVERQIAPINFPKVMSPQIQFSFKVEWIVTNNSSSKLFYHVVHDGTFREL